MRIELGMRLRTILSKPVAFVEAPGVISRNSCYVVIWGPFMYCGETILELMGQMIFGFASVSNFVGF